MTTKLTFQIFNGDKWLRTQWFTQPMIKIGKLPSSHLHIDDDWASRMHAIIEVDHDGSIWIVDMGSLHGTSVNGKQFIGKTKLHSGDVITIGQTRLELTVGDPEEHAKAAAPDTGSDHDVKRGELLARRDQEAEGMQSEIERKAAEFAGVLKAVLDLVPHAKELFQTGKLMSLLQEALSSAEFTVLIDTAYELNRMTALKTAELVLLIKKMNLTEESAVAIVLSNELALRRAFNTMTKRNTEAKDS